MHRISYAKEDQQKTADIDLNTKPKITNYAKNEHF